MQSVKQLNGLNGAIVSREKIGELIVLATSEEQFAIADRLSQILNDYPNKNSFEIDLVFPASPEAPTSILHGIEFDDEMHLQGLGKAVTSNDIYDNLTQLMINTIKEVGYLPWQKEWSGSGIIGARNFVTGKPYTGINFHTLNYAVKYTKDNKPYLVLATQEPQYYLTFNQIKDLGARLKKGSKGREVIYYNFVLNYKDDNLSFSGTDSDKFATFVKSNSITEAQVKSNLKRIPLLKYYNVFNSNDCEGLKEPKQIQRVSNINEYAQFILDNYPNKPDYRFGTDRAFYSPSGDYVSMPLIGAFKKESSYYSTFFHEMTHSTMHPDRLDRDRSGRFGDKAYAFEELIAELGATFLCSETGILFETIDNSAKYLKGWNSKLIEHMEDDNKFFMKAAAAAQKSTNYILDKDNAKRAIFKDTEKKEVKKPTAVKKKVTVVEEKKTDPQKKKVTVGYRKEKALKVDQKTRQIALFRPKANKKKKALKGPIENLIVSAILGEPENVTNEVKNITIQPEIITQNEQKNTPTDNLDVNSLAYKMAQRKNAVHEYYKIPNKAISDFLGNIEKKKRHSVAITIAGGEGSGKTRLCFQLMNCFAQNYKVGHISSEEHPDSDLYEKKVLQYLNEKAKANISAPEVNNMSDVHKLIEECDVIVVDSFSKMLEMQKDFRLDKDLRQKYDGKLFIVIFQLTSDGKMRGGATSQFDGDIICHITVNDDYKQNFCYYRKNRYSSKTGLQFNIFKGALNPTEPKALPQPQVVQNTTHEFNFI